MVWSNLRSNRLISDASCDPVATQAIAALVLELQRPLLGLSANSSQRISEGSRVRLSARKYSASCPVCRSSWCSVSAGSRASRSSNNNCRHAFSGLLPASAMCSFVGCFLPIRARQSTVTIAAMEALILNRWHKTLAAVVLPLRGRRQRTACPGWDAQLNRMSTADAESTGQPGPCIFEKFIQGDMLLAGLVSQYDSRYSPSKDRFASLACAGAPAPPRAGAPVAAHTIQSAPWLLLLLHHHFQGRQIWIFRSRLHLPMLLPFLMLLGGTPSGDGTSIQPS